jgi:hypothetical protein
MSARPFRASSLYLSLWTAVSLSRLISIHSAYAQHRQLIVITISVQQHDVAQVILKGKNTSAACTLKAFRFPKEHAWKRSLLMRAAGRVMPERGFTHTIHYIECKCLRSESCFLFHFLSLRAVAACINYWPLLLHLSLHAACSFNYFVRAEKEREREMNYVRKRMRACRSAFALSNADKNLHNKMHVFVLIIYRRVHHNYAVSVPAH